MSIVRELWQSRRVEFKGSRYAIGCVLAFLDLLPELKDKEVRVPKWAVSVNRRSLGYISVPSYNLSLTI